MRTGTLGALGAAAAIAIWLVDAPSMSAQGDAELAARADPLGAVEVLPFLPRIDVSELALRDLADAPTLDERLSAPPFSFSVRPTGVARPAPPPPVELAPVRPEDLPSSSPPRPTGARGTLPTTHHWGGTWTPATLPAPRGRPRSAAAVAPVTLPHSSLPAGLPASRDGRDGAAHPAPQRRATPPGERARRKLFSDRK
jgi:hypothetical protein